MDSMLELFYEESNNLVTEMRESLEKGCKTGNCGQSIIQDMFRGVHTLKANSTMMLFEGMASLSRTLEQLLNCLRNNFKEVTDIDRFSKIIREYLDYVKNELDAIYQGKCHDAPCDDIKSEVKSYLTDLTGTLKKNGTQIKKNDEKKPSKNKIQRYYIPSAGSVPARSDDKNEKSKDGINDESEKPDSVVLLHQSELERLRQCIEKYTTLLNTYNNKMDDAIERKFFASETKQFNDTKDELNDIYSSIVNGDFIAVSKKLELLVDEMSEALNKPVKLLVQGEDLKIEKKKRDKLSNALIHVIRNAVDHGIESMERREQLGKSPMGLIRLEFTEDEDDNLVITVEDDGAGINRAAVLQSAYDNNLIDSISGDYSDEDIIGFLLKNGISTTKEPNDYSGRGVGMDVIVHQVNEIGGKLDIKFREDFGTKVIMTIKKTELQK